MAAVINSSYGEENMAAGWQSGMKAWRRRHEIWRQIGAA